MAPLKASRLSHLRMSSRSKGAAPVATNSPKPNNGSDIDVILSIIPHLDVPTLLSLRLVSRDLNAIIKDHESWVCTTIAKNHYSWIFDYNDKAFRDLKHPPAHLSRFSSFRSVIRLHVATILPLMLLWNQFKGQSGQDATLVLPARRTVASCARGFLILWALADIEHDQMGLRAPRLSYEEYFASNLFDVPVKGACDHETISTGSDASKGFPDARYLNWWQKLKKSVTNRTASQALPPQGPKHEIKLTEELTEKHRRSQQCRHELIAELDQGSWMDLHVATTLVLAFCVAYMGSGAQLPPGSRSRTRVVQIWQASEWALRQGPDLLLCVLSTQTEHRKWISQWVERQWEMRSEEVKNIEQDHTSLGPLGISGVDQGRYPHPKCETWEADGWPTLLDCGKDMLFREWDTYRLQENPAARRLAAALRERTGGVRYSREAVHRTIILFRTHALGHLQHHDVLANSAEDITAWLLSDAWGSNMLLAD